MKDAAREDNTLSFQADFQPEESLKRRQGESEQERELRFFTAIKNARFLVPCTLKRTETGERMYPTTLNTPDGEKFLPAFSARGELDKRPLEQGRVSIYSFDDLKHTMLADPQNLAGIVINPFGKAMVLRPSQIEQIDRAVQGMSVRRVWHEKGLRLLHPGSLPSGLAEGMKDFWHQRREVRRVYLILAQEPEKPEPHWLFLIDFDGAESDLFPQVAQAVKGYMKRGFAFELLKAPPRLLEMAVARGEPLFQREED
ncbi:hypothetical protein SDC9_21111 [bioreactor metagenome]|uniref:SseB protein N-terminal domain-containing protein n=1 Tax=bioreactor metagenome TaxID=1076179 RepID=A0A644U8K7_9ZZZZ|nr:enhanced serine sensitivity protein SseB C-terminal domain-containing protein [Desulfitobacterium hafniense]MEA5023435.1 enhanced serine sensitivity protein SseB C-terminal domain-containing protein [Desulfitobacterium hafniense]